MEQVFLVLLPAVTFDLIGSDPRPTDLTQAKSAWSEKAEASIDTSTHKHSTEIDDV